MRALPTALPLGSPLGLSPDDPRAVSGGGLGPEIAPSLTDGLWSLSGSVTQGASGIVFTDAANAASAYRGPPVPIKNGAGYRIEITIADWTEGTARVQLYGTDHLGQTSSTEINNNGTFVKYVTVVPGGSFDQLIRIQALGPTTPGNTFRVAALSIREVLS